ncbi:protease [Aeromonas diversa]|uniref:protease n=1 Tax=Aeromonas diversa TaxID=502790 RepID=UPI003461E8FA
MMSLLLVALHCELAAAPKSRVTDPLPLTMTLSNRGDKPLSVLTWFTPFEGWFGDAILLTRDGEPVLYRGPLAKRGEPGADELLTLAPGQSEQASAELGLVYDIKKPGHYRLTYRFPLVGGEWLLPDCPPLEFVRLAN